MSFSKTDHAYGILRRQILDGRLRPGERLRLSHIAQAMDLSEMPVREALRLLQRDGLVLMHLHRGAEVARLSFQDAWNIEEVRLDLEARACRSAAPFHDAASRGRLDVIIDHMDAAHDHAELLARLNRNFHTELMSLAPNAFLREHVQELWDRAWQLSSASFFEYMPHRMARLPAEGRAILACIAAGDWPRLDAVLAARIAEVTQAWHQASAAYAERAGRDAPQGEPIGAG